MVRRRRELRKNQFFFEISEASTYLPGIETNQVCFVEVFVYETDNLFNFDGTSLSLK